MNKYQRIYKPEKRKTRELGLFYYFMAGVIAIASVELFMYVVGKYE